MMSNKKSVCICKHASLDLKTSNIIVNRTDSNFTKAAIKVLLDNIAGPDDVKNIFRTDCKLKSEAEAKHCEFCKKTCKSCQLCCSSKGLQLYLLNRALERINCIPRRCRNILCRSSKDGKCSENCSEKCKKNLPIITQSILNAAPFKELQIKLKNLKKFYPRIYKFKGNIIEEWGRNDMLCKIKPDVLKYDSKRSKIFWI